MAEKRQVYPSLLVFLTIFFARVISAVVHVEHEYNRELNNAWVRGQSVKESVLIPVRISLAQSNLESGHQILMDISDPRSTNFGRQYSKAEVIDLFAPSIESVDAVRNWIQSNTMTQIQNIRLSPNKQWIHFVANASTLNAMLKTTYHEYLNKETGSRSIGCDSYQVPYYIRQHIDYVVPGVKHIIKKKSNLEVKRITSHLHKRSRSVIRGNLQRNEAPATDGSRTSTESSCEREITPHCIRLLYNITDVVKNVSGNTIGIFERGSYLKQSDMNKFFQEYAPEIPQNTFPTERRVDGAPTEAEGLKYDSGYAEPALDFQVAYPLVYPTEVELFQVDDIHWSNQDVDSTNRSEPTGLFNTFFDAIDGSYCDFTAFGITGDSPKIDPVYPDDKGTGPEFYKGSLQCGVFDPPKVISLSYGVPESHYPVNYQRRQCQEMMKLGLQGITILSASGDSGVAGTIGKCLGPNGTVFQSSSNANCPYVTSVGGTFFNSGTPGINPEVAAQFSGGGFSNIFPIPEYQNATVNSYFKDYPPPYKFYRTEYDNNATFNGRYNRAGRGIPDVSANGLLTVIVLDGKKQTSGGTSASTPIWAGITTRINAARLAAGKKSIGFLNPILYSHPEVFNDIVNGSNPGCKSKGFQCEPGWDPVTGLGTPNYPKLKELLVNLP